MIESLNGKVDMTTVNGAIAGVDVDKVLSNIERGRLDCSTSPAEKTPFSEFAGSYTIANGVAQNHDLRLVSRSLRVTGTGTVDLAKRQLDYTVNPEDRRRVSSAEHRRQSAERRDPHSHRGLVGQPNLQPSRARSRSSRR